MHQPPAVVWKVAKTWFQGGALLVLAALVLCVHGTWWLRSGAGDLAQMGAAAAAGAALLYAWRDWRDAPAGELRWDGQAWSWSGPSGVAQAAAAVVAMDFQFLMLVRVELPDHGCLWCWVGRGQDVALWRSLRRALFAGAGAGAAGPPAPAKPSTPPLA